MTRWDGPVLDRLAAVRDLAAAGQPSVLVIEGESGVGKSTLLDELASGADGFRVMTAAGYESGVVTPYAVLAEWDVAVTAGASIQVAAQRLREVLDDRPTLLVLDDLQWADPESVAVLCAVVGRAQGDRLLAGVATRPLSPDAHPDWQRWCARSGRAEVLPLTGLDLPAATALVRERRAGIDDVTARALWEHTAGNPLHLGALAAEFEPDELAATSFLPAPAAYARAVAARLFRLPAEAVSAAQGLAVLGDRWSPLLALTELVQLPDLSGPVQRLVEAQLAQLRAAAAPAVRIAHALTRAAIYQETPLPVRRVLHARAATLVSGRGAVLDHRRAAAERYDDDLAAELEDYAQTLYEQRSYRLASHYQAIAAEVTRDQAVRERRFLESMFERLLAGDRHAVRAAHPAIMETSDPVRQTVVLGAAWRNSERSPGEPADLITRLGAADRLVEACEQDDADAQQVERAAAMFSIEPEPWAGMSPEEQSRYSPADRDRWYADQDQIIAERRAHVGSRALSPQQRSAWLHEQNAIARRRQTFRALQSARAARDALVKEFDAISRPDLGLAPAPPHEDSWMSSRSWEGEGLSSRDRDR